MKARRIAITVILTSVMVALAQLAAHAATIGSFYHG